MVELRGVPLLKRQLDALKLCGITDITVVTGYRSEAVNANDVRMVHNPRYAVTNMVASLAGAWRYVATGDDLLISYGDIVCEPSVIRAALASPAGLSVVVDVGWLDYWTVRFEDPLGNAETMRINDEGNITELGGVPQCLEEIEGQYIGLIKVRSELFGLWSRAFCQLYQVSPGGFERMYMTDFLQHLIYEGTAPVAIPVSHGWLEVDQPSDVALYHKGALDVFYNASNVDRMARL